MMRVLPLDQYQAFLRQQGIQPLGADGMPVLPVPSVKATQLPAGKTNRVFLKEEGVIKLHSPRYPNWDILLRREDRMLRFLSVEEVRWAQKLIERVLSQQGHAALITQYEGPELFTAIKNKPLPLQIVRQIAQRLFETVKDIHAFGVAHGDIKPENTTINLTVIDWAFAATCAELAQLPKPMTLRTATYAPWELMLGVRLAAPCHYLAKDVYSIGVTLVALYARQSITFGTPPVGMTDPALINACYLHWFEDAIGPFSQDLLRLIYDQMKEMPECPVIQSQTGYEILPRPAEAVKVVHWAENIIKPRAKANGDPPEEVEAFLQLLEGLLRLDPGKRWRASTALRSKFFQPLHDESCLKQMDETPYQPFYHDFFNHALEPGEDVEELDLETRAPPLHYSERNRWGLISNAQNMKTEDIQSTFQRALQALQEVHNEGQIHGTIRSTEVCYVRGLLPSKRVAMDNTNQMVTQNHLPYLSWEAILQIDFGSRIDLYQKQDSFALGTVLFEWYTGFPLNPLKGINIPLDQEYLQDYLLAYLHLFHKVLGILSSLTVELLCLPEIEKQPFLKFDKKNKRYSLKPCPQRFQATVNNAQHFALVIAQAGKRRGDLDEKIKMITRLIEGLICWDVYERWDVAKALNDDFFKQIT